MYCKWQPLNDLFNTIIFQLLCKKKKQFQLSTAVYYPDIWAHNDLRCSHAAFEVSEGFLRGEEVVILVLEVVKLQIASSIHPEQLVSCGPNEEIRKKEKKQRGKQIGKEKVSHK